MKTLAFVFFCAVIVACNGQDKKVKGDPLEQPAATKGNQPRVQVKVNRKYDEKGNLIRFDSTYTYFYSDRGRDSSRIGLDTIFQRFKSKYKTDFPGAWGSGFNELFFNDSLFRYDFLNEDFFTRRFEMNMQHMRQMFLQMDSIKTDYLRAPAAKPGKEKNRPEKNKGPSKQKTTEL
jgi:hypothetical protein